MSEDLRSYSRQTTIRLVLGFVILLLVVGEGLIYLIYGRGPAIMGLFCMLLGLAPMGIIWMVLQGMDWIVKRVDEPKVKKRS
jgi:hypothetical protein